MPTAQNPGKTKSPSLPAERMIVFSDAVVAIAITFLVLPLLELVPEAADAGDTALEVVTRNRLPFASFLLTFMIIWRVWAIHHQMFAGVSAVTRRITSLNMVWLACIVILPFVVSLVGEYGADPFVLVLYVGTLLASCAVLTAMALLLRRRPADQNPQQTTDTDAVEQLTGNAICLTVAFIIVLLAPAAGFWPLLLLLVDRPVLRVARRSPLLTR